MSAGAIEPADETAVAVGKAPPREFFTLQSIGTLAGASSGLYVIVGAISQATDWDYPRWFPLAVAFALVILVDLAVTQGWKGGTLRQLPARMLVLTLNSCLVFTSALGGAIAVRGHADEAPAEPAMAEAQPHAPEPPPTESAPRSAPAHAAPVAAKPAKPEPPKADSTPAPSASPASPRSTERPAIQHVRRIPTRAPRGGFDRIVNAFK